MKKLALLLFFSLPAIFLLAQAPPSVEMTIEQVQAGPGDEVCLSISVQNFRDVQGMQWGLRWNPEVLAFTQLTNFNLTDLDLPDFNVGAAPEGTIRLSWFTLQPPFSVSVDDQTTIVDICFRIKESAPPGFSAVAFDNELITTEFVVDPDLYDAQVVELPQMQTGGVQIINPGAFSLAPEFVVNSGCGGLTSTIDVTPSNGIAPFTYQWTGPNNFMATQSRITVSVPGIYELTVTDASNQQAIGYFPVSVHGAPDTPPLPDFILTSVVEDATCEENNGSITVIPNPEDQYSFLWSTGDTTPTIANLTAGTYQLDVSNNDGCTQYYSFAVGQDEGFEGITLVEDSLSCTDGFAQIGVIAESGEDYSYLWNTGDTTNLIDTSQPGLYQLTVTSEPGCALPFQFVVGEAQLDLSFNRIDGNLGCTDTMVTIGLLMQQDTDGLAFQWEDGPATTQRTVQQPGTYRLQVTQGICSRDFTFRVEQQEDGPLFYQRINQPFSCTAATARIGVANFGNLNYEFSWENRSETTGVIEVATEGTYTLTIRSGRCSVQETFDVAPFTRPGFSFVQRFDDQLNCNPQDSARIGLRAASGTSYTYQWSTGDTTPVISVTDTQSYQLTVTEGICAENFSFRVDLNPAKEYDLLLDNITCADTIAEIGITNAPDYFRLDLSPPDSSLQRIRTPDPGIYSLTILGGERCVFSEQIEVATANNPAFFNRIDDKLDCTDIDTALIGLQPLSGFGESLNYIWNTEATDPAIAVTAPGAYEVTVTGNGNCAERYAFTVVTRSTDITYERVENQLNCRDNTTSIGVRDVQPGRVTYAWSNNDTMAITDISLAGTYQLTITDPATQCQRIETFNQAPREIGQASITGECVVSGLCSGQARYTATVVDGLAPFTYRWNTGQTDTVDGPGTIILAQLADVAVTVTDARGCRVELAADALPCTPLNEFKARMYFDCAENPSAPEGTINAEVLSGGLPPYRYKWNNGRIDTSYFRSTLPFISGPETYEVTITDATGQQQSLVLQDANLFSCGNQQDPNLTYLAPHATVEPGNTFRYSVRATDYAGVERSVYTIDWDPCRVSADTIHLYRAEDTLTFSDLNPLEGTFEVSIGGFDPIRLPDTITIAEIVFTALEEGVSPFLFTVNEPATGVDGKALPIRPQHGSITVANPDNLVQAGDANRDGAIDHFDALTIGLGYGEEGPNRRRYVQRGEEFAFLWGTSTPGSQINYRHLDSDGSGQINAEDLDLILANWTPIQRPAIDVPPGSPKLFIESDTLTSGFPNQLEIHLGTPDQPVAEAYGLAFSLDYSSLEIQPGLNINLDLYEGWLQQDDFTFLVHQEREEQVLHIAITGINGQNRSGAGPIGRFQFVLDENASGPAQLILSDALLISAEENILPVATESTTLVIDQLTGQRNAALDQRIRLFPNPSAGMTRVTADGLNIQEIIVRNGQGQLLRRQAGGREVRIEGLSTGIFILQILTDQGIAVRRLIVVQP